MAAWPRGASRRAPGRLIARLHLVTDDVVLRDPGFLNSATQIIHRLGDRVAVHVRSPSLPAAQLYQLAIQLHDLNSNTPIIINDRIDVALASGAAGVQLGARSIAVSEARPLLTGKFIGYSAHDVAEAKAAAGEGADWLFAGTIYPTATHPGVPPAGPNLLRECAATCRIPVLAIGGITAERVPEVRAAGAYGVAIIRAVWSAADPVQAAEQFARLLEL